jgi:hypothetical protein
MSTSHLAPAAVSAAVGGETAFSFGRLGDRHTVKTSRRPGDKAAGQCKAIAAKTCPFKHGHLDARLVVIFNRFSDQATDNLPRHLWRSISQLGQTRKSGNAIEISDLP